jgi:hypothetical protein
LEGTQFGRIISMELGAAVFVADDEHYLMVWD